MILGLESSVLRISIERGLIGLVSYIYMWRTLYKYGKRHSNKIVTFSFILTNVLMEFVTGEFNLILQGTIYMAVMKYYDFRNYNMVYTTTRRK